MGETLSETLQLICNPIRCYRWVSPLSPDLLAMKIVAYDQRAGFILFTLVGVVGLFLGDFVLLYYGLDEYLEPISEFRILFDLIAAYIGSFLVAAIIHFIKPT